MNKNVEGINSTKLELIPHQQFIYKAEDWESETNGQLKTLVKSCMAPSSLKLKINAQVMLVKNFTQQLVNGSKGVVVGWFSIASMEFYDEHREVSEDTHFLLPVVRFINGQTKIIPWTEWTLRDENDQILAIRIQVNINILIV